MSPTVLTHTQHVGQKHAVFMYSKRRMETHWRGRQVLLGLPGGKAERFWARAVVSRCVWLRAETGDTMCGSFLGCTRVLREQAREGGGRDLLASAGFSNSVSLKHSVRSGATFWGSVFRTLSKASGQTSTQGGFPWAGRGCLRGNTRRLRSEMTRASPEAAGTSSSTTTGPQRSPGWGERRSTHRRHAQSKDRH